MTLERLLVQRFAGLRDLRVDFAPGINLVIGPNEAGKSTVLAAIRHTLLTTTHLTKPRFASTMARYLPRPDGDAAECELVFRTDARYELRRRWGAAPQTTLVLPAGTSVLDTRAHEQIAELLPVRPGTYRTLFLVDQATLDQTVRVLGDDHETREELFAALRDRDGAGVSVDAFRRILEDRIAKHYSRWDRERSGPERGRGIDHRWEKQAGVQLQAWYAWKEEEAALREIEQAEADLEAADRALRTAVEQESAAAGFVTQHAAAYESSRDDARVQRELEALSGRMKELRDASRRWPVLIEDQARVSAERAAAKEEAESATARLHDAAERREEAALRLAYQRIVRLQDARQAAAGELDRLPKLDDALVRRFASLERGLDAVRVRMETGLLRARVTVDAGRHGGVEVRRPADTRPGPEAQAGAPPDGPAKVGPGETLELSARGFLALELDGVTVELETGEQPYAELVAEHDRIRAELGEVRSDCGVASSDEARSLLEKRSAAAREVARLDDELGELAGGLDLDELHARFGSDASGEAATQDADPGDPDEAALAEAVAQARETLGAAESRAESIASELAALEKRHESQDALEDAMLELRASVRELEKKRSGAAALPDGFADTDAFLAEYDSRRESLSDLRSRREAARVQQATLLAAIPDRTADEARDSCNALMHAFERADRHGRALLRLRDAVDRAESDESPAHEAARRLTRYLRAAAGDRFADPRIPDGHLAPTTLAFGSGPDLEYDLLSQGTRDIVSLAVRLALAESAAAQGSAPLLLDDPLVDMDPARREGSARAIRAYAEDRQVVLFTCHPEVAALFPDASIVRLSGPGPTTDPGDRAAR